MPKRRKPNPYEKPRERYIPSVKFKRPEFTTIKPRQSRLVYLDADLAATRCESLNSNFPHPNLHTIQLRYEDDEMTKREAVAQVEKKRKSKMVAPLYSKGPVQYFGGAAEEIIRNLGKKI
jgi:hypothetical protein